MYIYSEDESTVHFCNKYVVNRVCFTLGFVWFPAKCQRYTDDAGMAPRYGKCIDQLRQVS